MSRSEGDNNNQSSTMRAMQQHFERLNIVLEEVRDRLDRHDERLNELQRRRPAPLPHGRRHHHQTPPPQNNHDDDDDEYDEDSSYSIRRDRGARQERPRHDRRGYRQRDAVDHSTGSIKLTIPSFQGRSDPDAYIEWERQVEFVFDCHNYSEEKKVKLAAVAFTDYAITWWDKLITNRRRN